MSEQQEKATTRRQRKTSGISKASMAPPAPICTAGGRSPGTSCPRSCRRGGGCRTPAKAGAKTASGDHNDLYPRAAAALEKFLGGEEVTNLVPVKGDRWPFDLG